MRYIPHNPGEEEEERDALCRAFPEVGDDLGNLSHAPAEDAEEAQGKRGLLTPAADACMQVLPSPLQAGGVAAGRRAAHSGGLPRIQIRRQHLHRYLARRSVCSFCLFCSVLSVGLLLQSGAMQETTSLLLIVLKLRYRYGKFLTFLLLLLLDTQQIAAFCFAVALFLRVERLLLHEKKPIATKPDRLLSASSIATFVTVASSTLRPCVEML